MTTANKKTILILLAIVFLIAMVPLFLLQGAEFGGTDDAGSQVVSEITGTEYEPWFTPVMENWINGEIPGEVESLLFCLQTGIGVGVLFFFIGKFSERTKWEKKTGKKISDYEKEE